MSKYKQLNLFDIGGSAASVFKIYPKDAQLGHLRDWIELSGGITLEDDEDDSYAISIVDVEWFSGSGVDSRSVQVPTDHFLSSFIYDCYQWEMLFDLNLYRIGESRYNTYDANKILKRQVSWSELTLRCETEGGTDELSDSEFLITVTPKKSSRSEESLFEYECSTSSTFYVREVVTPSNVNEELPVADASAIENLMEMDLSPVSVEIRHDEELLLGRAEDNSAESDVEFLNPVNEKRGVRKRRGQLNKERGKCKNAEEKKRGKLAEDEQKSKKNEASLDKLNGWSSRQNCDVGTDETARNVPNNAEHLKKKQNSNVVKSNPDPVHDNVDYAPDYSKRPLSPKGIVNQEYKIYESKTLEKESREEMTRTKMPSSRNKEKKKKCNQSHELQPGKDSREVLVDNEVTEFQLPTTSEPEEAIHMQDLGKKKTKRNQSRDLQPVNDSGAITLQNGFTEFQFPITSEPDKLIDAQDFRKKRKKRNQSRDSQPVNDSGEILVQNSASEFRCPIAPEPNIEKVTDVQDFGKKKKRKTNLTSSSSATDSKEESIEGEDSDDLRIFDTRKNSDKVVGVASISSSFVCKFCSFTTVTPFELVEHMRLHTGVHPYPCPYCNFCAKDTTLLKKHKKLHGLRGSLKCLMCSYETADCSDLKIHSKSHELELSRSYECPSCDFKGDTAYKLRVHRISHNEKV